MFSTLPTLAHELWIEADAYQISPQTGVQTRLVANIVNGQDFSGHPLPYLPRVAVRLDNVAGGTITAIEARAGDRPAIDIVPTPDALNVIVYQATNASLTYHDGEKFWSFVEHKDLPVTREEHTGRGLPEVEFKEVYSRYSKALIGVGDATGMDENTGLLTELVALANPYTTDISAPIPVQLFYQGTPRADAQIEVFEDDGDGTVKISTMRTGPDGIALLHIIPGMTYMLDAVVLREPAPELAAETGAVYESLWANLTFAVP